MENDAGEKVVAKKDVRILHTPFFTYGLLPALLFVSNLGIEPTDVRPAPERDRPTEGCQLAVLDATGG